MQQFLYDISERRNALIEAALEMADDKEAVDAIAVALEGMSGEISDVVYNGIGYIKSREALIDGLKAEEKRLKARRQVAENQLERVKQGYTAFLLRVEHPKVETARGNMVVPKARTQTVIDDISLVPDAYIRQKLTVEPDKESIKQAIQLGKRVPGAHLEEKRMVQIR